MSQLMLISGLEDRVSILKLIDYLKATYLVQNVWMDPHGEPRVVVLCDKKLDLRDIKTKARYLETAKPTASVFVKTSKCITFGAKDKLKYLFTSQRYGGRKVVKVEQLNTKDDDCYELYFLNWGDVLKICNETWKVEEQTLTVIPFFESFKEPFKQQLKRLNDLNETSTQAKIIFVPETQTVNRPSVMLKPSEMPRKLSFQGANASVDLKSAKPLLEHRYILTLLHLLNFEHAVQHKYNMVTVTICERNWEVEIKGPVASLKIIQKLLTEEDELDHPALIERFLGNMTALQDLKNFIDSAGLYVDIVDTQGKPFLQVTDGAERKEIFHDFIFTLVISKECSPLPSRECQQQQEWTNFVELFDRTYTHQQLFVEDTSVTLVCLASKSLEMDFIVNIINNTIIQLKRDLKAGSHKDDYVPTPDQNSMIPDESSQSSGNTSSAGGKENTKFKQLTIGIQNSAFLWILNILNLKNSLRQTTHNLDVDIDEDEEEITISGSKDLLQRLKAVLTMEDKKFQFTENEKVFLCDPIVRRSLNSCLITHGCCIVLQDDLEMFVARKDGHKAQFRNFLTSFIQFKTISHLSEEYQQTKEWNSLLEYCKNNYPHHHILTAKDEVYLLSIGPEENNTDADSVLKKVDKVITALTSPGLPEEHLSLAEKIGHQKCEDIKTDGGKISASDKSSTRKLTLYYKHPILIRILQTLQLKEAAQKFEISVTMSSDHEIIIEGSKKTVRSLQSSLIKEDEMPFEDQEEFLMDKQVQQKVESCLNASEAHLVLDDNLELFVVTKSGEQAQFRHFLTSFLHFKTVSLLPEEYQQTKEWNSLLEHCNNNYPHHHIFTAEDKVYLLSIAPDEHNTDADSVLKKVDKVITALTSSGLPGKHLSLAEEIGDQKREEITTDSGKISASGKSNTKKLTLYCKHPVLIRILQTLQLKEAAQKFGIFVIMPSDNDIIIEGSKKAVKSLKSALIKEENEMPFEDQEEFLTKPRVNHYLVSCLKDSRAHLVLDDSFELFVVTKFGEKEQFRAFITRFIQVRKCAHMPEKYQNDFAWKTKLQQFEEHDPHHHILINGEEVHLVTFAYDDKSHEANSVMERINKAISDSCLFLDSDMRDEDEHHIFCIKCPKIKIEYFSLFLIKELQDEYEKWQSCQPKVTFMEDRLQISSFSRDATTKIASKLEKLLCTIKHQTKYYKFPGLSTYLNSTRKPLIDKLSDQYECLIEVPDRDHSHLQHLSLNEEQSSEMSQGLGYKVIFLGTANCGSFNIHLVQGDLNNLKIEMKIQVQPSEEVETCEIRSCGSSQKLMLHLPPWLVPNEDDSHSHLEELRSSFYNAVSVAFERAEHLGHNDIAFSTELLTKSEHPFPPSVIAKGIIEMLCEKTGLNHASSQTENTLVDFYVCDPENEAVFKAFQFFLKRRHKYLGTPSQVAWDKVCFPDSYKYPDYNSFKSQGIHIEVSSKIPFSLGNNTCICYPIHPSLEISTCPALKENSFAEKALKSSLQDLQRKNPDGLLIGEIFPLSGFFDGRNSFVYCSPDWGVDCDQAVDRILEACIGKSGHCDVIYIVPPGIQMLSKYPVGYLVQIFFRKLDSIMQNKTYLLNKKKCVLLVQDFVYRKAFDQELQKRYPKPKERGIIEGFLNLFRSTEQADNVSSNSPKTICKTSSVPSTEIVLWSTSEDNIQKMAQELGKQLSNLMKDNTMSRQLNKEETRRFLNKVHNFQSRDIQVSISITEYYEMESHFQEQHKKKQKKKKQKHSGHVKRDSNQIILSSSILSIEGLDKHYLHEFLSKTGLARDMDEHGNFFQKEALQEETSVPVKNSEKDLKKETSFPKETSVKSIENAKSFGGNDRQQEQNSKFSKNKLATNSVRLQANCHHKWLQQSARGDSFEMIKTEIGQNIEDAYIKGKDQQELNGDTSVDFTSMTVTINGTERNIIRIEVLGKDFILQKIQKLTKVGDNTGKYQEIKSNLDECIGKYKLSLIEISEVPKNTLHIRFEKKSADLKDKSVDSLWHRILSNYNQHVCTYGFHPKFSGMPDAKHLGEGVLFCKEPENCFNLEVEKEEEILLVYSKVLIGRSCSGAPGLRCLPSDETTGRCFDSVSENGAYMIFSDAQAYPEYVVTLKVKK